MLFYGYGAAEIAHWCGISYRTALAYKRGSRKPSASVARLFVLHRDGQVVPVEWGRGWLLSRTKVVTPEAVELPVSWLRNYQLLVQWARRVACDHGLRDEFDVRLSRIGG
jgi:hypothetical protein